MNRPHHAPAAVPPLMTLRAALAGAAAELERHQPPAWLERATLARLPAARTTAPRRLLRRGLAGWPGAAALAGVLAVSLLLLLVVPLPPVDERQGLAEDAPSGFVPLASADSLVAASDRPAAAWLVTTEMPRERLAALGLPFDPSRAGESVRAELLMHGSGEVLAVRLLPE